MRETYQIIVLGPGGVGKTKGTHMLIQYLSSIGLQTSEVKPWSEDLVVTSNYVIHNFILPEGYFPNHPNSMNISIYDMGGQFKYKDMWKKLADDTDGILVVVDMTRKTTLQQVPLMLPKGIMENVPVKLLVNKADLYTSFARSVDALTDAMYSYFNQAIDDTGIYYDLKYRGENPFNFQGQIFKYGDLISVLRHFEMDETGNFLIRLADLEIIAARAFKSVLPNLTEHNAALFGREFTLQLFDVVYSWLEQTDTVLTDDIIMLAHMEAPPFISWGDDPDVVIPKFNKITKEAIKTVIQAMLIEDKDVVDMVEHLQNLGYNLNINKEEAWSLTSAQITQEDPSVPYKPINKKMITPSFIKMMLDYNTNIKIQTNDEFFF